MNEHHTNRVPAGSSARRSTLGCAIGLIAGLVLGLSPAAHAQSSHAQNSPDMAQMAVMLKNLEARVGALEAETQASKRDAAAARAEAQALRQKMRTNRSATVAPAAARTSTAVAAAASPKLYDVATPMVPSAQGWGGLYAGAAAGVGWMHSDLALTGTSNSNATFTGPPTLTSTSTSAETETFAGQSPGEMSSLFLGYNHMLNDNWLIGAQLEGTLANTTVNMNGGGITTSTTTSLSTPPGGAPTVSTATGPISESETVDNRWLVSVLARGGFLLDPADLVYVLGGYTYGRFEIGQVGTGFGMDGGTVGVGWERQIIAGWNLRAEYRYTRFASATVNFGETASSVGGTTASTSTLNEAFHFSDVDVQSVWLGVSHSFGP